jgi:hypothetical protein
MPGSIIAEALRLPQQETSNILSSVVYQTMQQ